jgi:hypothetical protein
VRGLWIRRLSFAAALGALIIVPLALRDSSAPTAADGFSSKGARSSVSSLELACGRQGNVCKAGDTLVFDLQPQADQRFFAGFSRRETDGAILWYFPHTPEAKSIDLKDHAARGILDKGVVIGPEHQPGRYTFYGIISPTELSRAEIKKSFTPGATVLESGASIIEKEIIVQ